MPRTYVPGTHAFHRSQRVAFVVALNVPLGQAAQARSLVDVGAEDSYVPGPQFTGALRGESVGDPEASTTSGAVSAMDAGGCLPLQAVHIMSRSSSGSTNASQRRFRRIRSTERP